VSQDWLSWDTKDGLNQETPIIRDPVGPIRVSRGTHNIVSDGRLGLIRVEGLLEAKIAPICDCILASVISRNDGGRRRWPIEARACQNKRLLVFFLIEPLLLRAAASVLFSESSGLGWVILHLSASPSYFRVPPLTTR